MDVHVTPEGKRYRLTRHAETRAAERRVSLEAIETALDCCEISHQDRHGNHCYVKTPSSSARLRLVVEANTDPLRIITVVVLN